MSNHNEADKKAYMLDPDQLIMGYAQYMDDDKTDVIFDFLARYVRKMHSDTYIKKTLCDNKGMTFLDIIGPSDIAYVITLIKNSKDVWMAEKTAWHDDDNRKVEEEEEGGEDDPVHGLDDDEDDNEKDRRLRPLFTSGEKKKREYGQTTWSDEGIDYYENGLKKWKVVFGQSEIMGYNFVTKWDEWVERKGKGMVLGTWKKKDVLSVVGTKEGTNSVDGILGTEKNYGKKNREIDFGVEQGFYGPYYPGSRVGRQWTTKYKNKNDGSGEADKNTE